MADTLTDYQRDVRRLLHDANKNYWDDQDLTDFINEARRHVSTDTGCLRSLYSVYLTSGQEKYSYGQACGALITAGGTGYTGTPTFTFGTSGTGTCTLTNGVITGATITNADTGLTLSSYTATITGTGSNAAITVYAIPANVVDIPNFTVLWGNQRIQLKNYAWSDFSAYFRPWVQYQSIPAAFSFYGGQGVYIGPTPNIQYQVELDSVVVPSDLTLGSTALGTLLGPPVDSVKYYASYLAYTQAQKDDKANRMLQLYVQSIQWVVNSFTRRLQGAYEANANVY